MEMIQNAYQGFAKQNYTMLDNLKLGYGGTKEEMQRLLVDAEKISGIKYDISNLNDVYNAIHVIQGELGITGTTAKEASETITGSISSMKSAFDNFLNGSGTIEQLVETGITAIQNIVNVLGELLPNIVQSIANATPQILDGINQIFPQILNIITTNAPTILSSIGQILGALLQAIIDYIPQLIPVAIQLIESFIKGLLSMLPQILEMGITLLAELIKGISQMLPELIPMAIDCIITLVFIDGIIYALPKLIEKAPEIIQKLIDALIRNFPKIVQAGGELLGKLIAGIVGSFWKLLEVAPQLISNIVNGLKQGWEEVKNVGKYLIEGLWNGISGMASWVADKVKSFARNIVTNMKNALGIHSPSKVFADEIGKYLGLGLGEGFEDSLSGVYKNMRKAVDYENLI